MFVGSLFKLWWLKHVKTLASENTYNFRCLFVSECFPLSPVACLFVNCSGVRQLKPRCFLTKSDSIPSISCRHPGISAPNIPKQDTRRKVNSDQRRKVEHLAWVTMTMFINVLILRKAIHHCPGMQVAGARLCCQAATPGGSELPGGFDASTPLGGREARGKHSWEIFGRTSKANIIFMLVLVGFEMVFSSIYCFVERFGLLFPGQRELQLQVAVNRWPGNIWQMLGHRLCC